MAPSTRILNPITRMVGSNLEPYLHITQSVQSDHGSKHSDPESSHSDGRTQSDYSDPQSDHSERPQGVRSSSLNRLLLNMTSNREVDMSDLPS